jgi:hypothetical protein
MPILRHTSSTDVPSSFCFKAKAIWSSVNLLLFTTCSRPCAGLHHAGRSVTNDAESGDRVKKRPGLISGGFNVYSVEVEQALMQHPDVQDSAVIGLPDDKCCFNEVCSSTCPGRQKGRREDAGRCAVGGRTVGRRAGADETPAATDDDVGDCTRGGR